MITTCVYGAVRLAKEVVRAAWLPTWFPSTAFCWLRTIANLRSWLHDSWPGWLSAWVRRVVVLLSLSLPWLAGEPVLQRTVHPLRSDYSDAVVVSLVVRVHRPSPQRCMNSLMKACPPSWA
jgi:hypothetical protein